MRRLAGVLGVVVVLAAGCGKSGGTSGSGSGSETTDTKAPVTLSGEVNKHGTKDVAAKGAKADLAVELDNYYFAPTFVKAAAGQQLTIALANDGKASHTFTLADGKVDEELAPGAKKTVTVTAPAGGVLVYFCRFHRGQGMQGAVFLKEGDTAGASTGTNTGGTNTGGTNTSTSGGYGY